MGVVKPVWYFFNQNKFSFLVWFRLEGDLRADHSLVLPNILPHPHALDPTHFCKQLWTLPEGIHPLPSEVAHNMTNPMSSLSLTQKVATKNVTSGTLIPHQHLKG
jgi:hypothetical protein